MQAVSVLLLLELVFKNTIIIFYILFIFSNNLFAAFFFLLKYIKQIFRSLRFLYKYSKSVSLASSCSPSFFLRLFSSAICKSSSAFACILKLMHNLLSSFIKRSLSLLFPLIFNSSDNLTVLLQKSSTFPPCTNKSLISI